MKIVVRTPNWIGDVILALPAIESLRHNFPQAQIWIAANEWVKDLLHSPNFMKRIINLPTLNDLKSLNDSAQKLKEFKFDIGLLLTNSFSSAFVFYLSKIPQRWGYMTDGRGFLLTKRVALKNEQDSNHQVNYYLNLISGLNLQTVPPEISLPLSVEEKEEARNRLTSAGLDLNKPLLILNPGASYGPAKRWPASRFAGLATLFQTRKNTEILIIGSSEEIYLAESISSLMRKTPASLAGKTTLRQLLALISHASLFITNDSGPMHMANALRIPVIAIFGPTDPRATGPFQQPSAVIKKEVSCWPCSYRECPYDHRCMTRIEPEEVYLVSQKYLQ